MIAAGELLFTSERLRNDRGTQVPYEFCRTHIFGRHHIKSHALSDLFVVIGVIAGDVVRLANGQQIHVPACSDMRIRVLVQQNVPADDGAAIGGIDMIAELRLVVFIYKLLLFAREIQSVDIEIPVRAAARSLRMSDEQRKPGGMPAGMGSSELPETFLNAVPSATVR